MSREALGKPGLVTIGEAWSADFDSAMLYSNPIKLDWKGAEKLDLAPLPFIRFKEVIDRWQTGLSDHGWNSFFWENHDLPRIVSHWRNDGKYRTQSSKFFAMLLFGLKGTPYIYQGQKLGMTNVCFHLEDYRYIETLNLFRERAARGIKLDAVLDFIHAKRRDNTHSHAEVRRQKRGLYYRHTMDSG